MEHWELAARESVRDLIAHYNLSGDRGWLDDMVDLFLPDAMLTINGVDHLGRDAIRAVFTQAKGPRPELIRHHVSTIKIDVADAEHATARAYFQVLTMRGLDHWGRYTDRFVRRDNRWWFSQRSVRVDGATPGGWAAMRESTNAGSAEQPGRHDVP